MDSHSVCLSGKILILPTFLNDSLVGVGMLAWSYSNTLKMPSQLSQWTRLLLKKKSADSPVEILWCMMSPFSLAASKTFPLFTWKLWLSRDSVKNTSYGTSWNSLGFKDVDIYLFFPPDVQNLKKKMIPTSSLRLLLLEFLYGHADSLDNTPTFPWDCLSFCPPFSSRFPDCAC